MEEKGEDGGKMGGALLRNKECEDRIAKGGGEEMHGEVQGRAEQEKEVAYMTRDLSCRPTSKARLQTDYNHKH